MATPAQARARWYHHRARLRGPGDLPMIKSKVRLPYMASYITS